MITDKSEIRVQGTISGQKIGMRFDENSLVHLMSVLTDLYSDPEQAIIREYSTNAFDSHVEAGQTRPIEVTTPTSLSPFFRVRDYGVGLDTEGIANIYSKYGASTKRETNEQSGVLGLGCKSALTYTSQFSLVGIKDGVRTVVSIGRDEDGAGSMTVVETNLTVEPNGVEIIIPVKQVNKIHSKAEKFFSHWASGTVLLNGQGPKPIEGVRVTDDLIVVKNKSSYNSENTIVMGNVPYPVESGFRQLNHGYSVIAFVQIGAVNFTPSREALQYTKKTREVLDDIQKRLADELIGAAQRDVDAATEPLEALRAVIEWTGIIPKPQSGPHPLRDLTYKGVVIPDQLQSPAGESFIVANARSYGKLSASSNYPFLAMGAFLDGLMVSGYTSNFTATHKKKLLQWAQENDVRVEHFILTNAPIVSPWVPSYRQIDWAEVQKIKLPATFRSGFSVKSLKGSYKVWINNDITHELAANDIDTSHRVFYMVRDQGRAAQEFLNEQYPDSTVVELGLNRVEKFKRDFPAAVDVFDGVRDFYKNYLASLSKNASQAYFIQHRLRAASALSLLNPRSIDDPEVVEAIRLATYPLREEMVDVLDDLNNRFRYISGVPVISFEEWKNPLDKYPLLTRIYSDHPHHYIYLNAAYAADKESK